jgi:hypothetical protein
MSVPPGLAFAAGVLAALSAACSSSSPTAAGAGALSPDGGGTDAGSLTTPEPIAHRAASVPCTAPRPAGTGSAMPGGTCATDADCTKGTNGRCTAVFPAPAACTYDQCTRDTDCGGASVCDCRNVAQSSANVCFHGDCVVDADCPGRGWCSPSLTTLGSNCQVGLAPGSVGYFCHTAADECTNDADCAGTSSLTRCAFSVVKAHWACFSPNCTR